MRYLVCGVAVAAALCTASAASAGVYSDDLGKCLVAKTSEADKTLLVQWIFSSMSVHPVVARMTSISAEQRRALSGKAGQLYQRLLITDCRTETVAALKYEGENSLESAFGILGQVAMKNLMNDPNVAKEMEALADGIDEAKLRALGQEAGLQPGGSAAPKSHP